MAERNSLLNCRTGNGTEGSNPSSSAFSETKELEKPAIPMETGFFIFRGLQNHQFLSIKR